MFTQGLNAVVRRAVAADADALASVHGGAWRQAYTGIIPALSLERSVGKRDASWWREAVRRERHLMVIDVGGVVAGYATCGRCRHASRHTGEIFELYIAPVFQGLGLGTHLFEACRCVIDGMDLPNLVVWALAQNETGCVFYRSCGGRPLTRARERFGPIMLEKIAFVW